MKRQSFALQFIALGGTFARSFARVSPPLARSFVSPSYFSLLAVFLWLEAAWSKFYHFFGAGLYSMNSNQRSQPKVPKVQLGYQPNNYIAAQTFRHSQVHSKQSSHHTSDHRRFPRNHHIPSNQEQFSCSQGRNSSLKRDIPFGIYNYLPLRATPHACELPY